MEELASNPKMLCEVSIVEGETYEMKANHEMGIPKCVRVLGTRISKPVMRVEIR